MRILLLLLLLAVPAAAQNVNQTNILRASVIDTNSFVLGQTNGPNGPTRRMSIGQIKKVVIADSGLATLASGTVTVTSPSANSTNVIMLTYYSLDGNVSSLRYASVVNGTSFTILSSNNSDANQVSWVIIKP